jgi:RimJ/RimL family protein N-acetyltransferase
MLIRSGDVTLMSFDAAHTDVVLELRNHPTVRPHMRDPSPISRESHYRWVQENLIDARRVHLFVAFSADEPVGITLLRNFRDSTAEIGVMVIEAEQRPLTCYAAAHLIAFYAFEVLDLESLYSYVPRHNERALSFNSRCGFEPTAARSDVYHELVFARSRYRADPTHRRFREKHGIEVIGGA